MYISMCVYVQYLLYLVFAEDVLMLLLLRLRTSNITELRLVPGFMRGKGRTVANSEDLPNFLFFEQTRRCRI